MFETVTKNYKIKQAKLKLFSGIAKFFKLFKNIITIQLLNNFIEKMFILNLLYIISTCLIDFPSKIHVFLLFSSFCAVQSFIALFLFVLEMCNF